MITIGAFMCAIVALLVGVLLTMAPFITDQSRRDGLLAQIMGANIIVTSIIALQALT